MNFLLAKMRGRNGEILKIASSATDIIEPPDLSSSHAYSSSYKLEEDEWFRIDDFSLSDFTNEIIGIHFSSVNYDQISATEFMGVKYFWIRQRGVDYFQKVLPSQVISQKWFRISDEPEIETNEKIIVLNPWADAVYVAADDSLYFKELTRIKVMFQGIEELFREATDEEVTEFLQNEFLTLTNGYDAAQIKVANRKRIAKTIETLNAMPPQMRAQIFDYIRGYCADLPVDGESFEISNEEDLKKVLYGIEERYYTTPLGGEKRLANSVMAIG